jgi:5-(aminomethyl)-3-furanmethanol phosphate kinase
VKSIDVPQGRDPVALAQEGIVDGAFPGFAAKFEGAIEIWGPQCRVAVETRTAA